MEKNSLLFLVINLCFSQENISILLMKTAMEKLVCNNYKNPLLHLDYHKAVNKQFNSLNVRHIIRKAVDLDGSNTIQFDQFLEIMSKIRKGDKKEKSAIYDFFKRMSSGDLGQDMVKELPFRLNVSRYRRRKILQCITTGDKEKKQKANKILQAFKKQLNTNSSLKQSGGDIKKISTVNGLPMYNRILNTSKKYV